MKKVSKAIILAAGWGARLLPITKSVHKEMLPILNKPLMHYLIEEIELAGFDEAIIVISPDKKDIIKYFESSPKLEKYLKSTNQQKLLKKVIEIPNILKITFVIQDERLGVGHAMLQVFKKINDEPFAVILGDDFIDSKTPAIKQLLEAFEKRQHSIIGVQKIESNKAYMYGIAEPNIYEKNKKLFSISKIIEKPKTHTSSNIAIIGRYIFTPELISLLRKQEKKPNCKIDITNAFNSLIKKEKLSALHLVGSRYDLGSMEGFVKANIDFSLKNKELKKSILKFMKELA